MSVAETSPRRSRPQTPATTSQRVYNNNDTMSNPALAETETGTRTGEQATKFTEDFRESRSQSVVSGVAPETHDSNTIKRQSSLKKRASLSRKGSLRRRSSSRRSRPSTPEAEDPNSAFFLPVPTQSNPTEILANRFTGWRRILKDYITYFKEVHLVYENRAKGIGRLYQTLCGAVEPDMFLRNGGILETTSVLKDYHKSSMLANEHARQGLSRIITLLTGLRNDLGTKIKEIKGLSGDFKNNLDKERDGTRKAVYQLTESLSAVDTNPSLVTGKNDPYIVKLSVDRQLRKQLMEENYLHRAYLNLEGSGRELESIIVNEIQKAFDSYVKILRNDGSELMDTAERLELQTLSLPGDHEWSSFVERDPNFVDPKVKVRVFEDVEYPGSKHPAALEVRSGPLERKSKYLKSYTPGWYVLSSSHLHEFKTPDRNHDLVPVMSLYLPDSAMGSHTDASSSSHKFMIKGRQTGHMHRGHSWVFRAASHQAMMDFYEDIKNLIALSGPERNAFVASHHRARSSASAKENGSNSSENGLDYDEADEIPYSAEQNSFQYSPLTAREERPEAGRFPSDMDIGKITNPKSTTSGDSEISFTGVAAPIDSPGFLEGQSVIDHTNSSLGYQERHDGPELRLNPTAVINYSHPLHDAQADNISKDLHHNDETSLNISNPPDIEASDKPGSPSQCIATGVPGNAVVALGSGSVTQHLEEQIQSESPTTMTKDEPTFANNQTAIDSLGLDITPAPNGYRPTHPNNPTPGVATRTNSNFTISELHVPGEYPKIPKS